MTSQISIVTLSAFIDSLGLVVARLLVVTMFSFFGAIPALLGCWYVITYHPSWSVFVAAYLFCAFAALIFQAWYLQSDLDIPFELNFKEDIGSSIASLAINCMLFFIMPFLIFLIILMRRDKGDSYLLVQRHYINENHIKSLLCYFDAVLAFGLGVYFLSHSEYRDVFFEVAHSPESARDAVLYTLDLVIRGLLFDFFEHFNIHISNVEQTPNLLGKGVSYVLRFASSVMAIALVFEMVSSTKQKLEALDVAGSEAAGSKEAIDGGKTSNAPSPSQESATSP